MYKQSIASTGTTINSVNILPIRAKGIEEQALFNRVRVQENTVSNNNKSYIPVVSGDTFKIVQIMYNEDYDFTKEVRIDAWGIENDIFEHDKNYINYVMMPFLNKHINKCIGLELNARANVIAKTDNLIDNILLLAGKRKVGSDEIILVNKSDFEVLASATTVAGSLYLKKIEDKFIFDNTIEVLVCDSIAGATLVDLNNIYVLLNGNNIENKETVELKKLGLKEFSSLFVIGIEIIYKENVYQIK